MNARDVETRTRSWLFTPATRPERFANAGRAGADVLIVDLEDAVRPEEKDTARRQLRNLLSQPFGSSAALAVRINTPNSRNGLNDLAALLDAEFQPAYIVIPKVEAAQTVLQVEALLCEVASDARVVPLVESRKGIVVLPEVLAVASRVAAVMFGAGDYAGDVGVHADSFALSVARVQISAACAVSDVRAIDAPCFEIANSGALEEEIRFAAGNGFDGKAAIHPSHVRSINAAMTPNAAKIDWAHRVIDAAREGAAVIDGRMVDEAIAREARRVLSRA
ncbi:aldolase/citrate lyase family protein [Paraburkholderia caribensis]|uniref:aldolase/citrate lyase family protein n=1 Tax=Paraburkholderia caribensis TaxID=75105 RepID=UPI0007C7BBDE|nr:aldolase/citrate lyase family protein [Paraburkholderia caribensis]AUT57910.1 CoA ester lyase [Paraburkholderia caribensis]